MEALIQLFGSIALFKKGPENVPASINLLFVLLFANFIAELFLGFSAHSLNLLSSALLSILSVSILMVFTWFWLMMFKLNNRVLQTLTTFIGISLFINIFCILPITLLSSVGILPDDALGLLYWFLFAWNLAIYAHIYKKSFNISFFLGFALSITLLIIINTLTTRIIGV